MMEVLDQVGWQASEPEREEARSCRFRVDLNPFAPFEKDLKSRPRSFLQIGSRTWCVGVKWLGPRR
jgi:hypothetical protein